MDSIVDLIEVNMDQKQDAQGQEEQERRNFLDTETMVDRALKTLEDLATNAKSPYVRNLAAIKLKKIRGNSVP